MVGGGGRLVELCMFQNRNPVQVFLYHCISDGNQLFSENFGCHFHFILHVISDKAAFVGGALFCVQRYRGNLALSRWQRINLPSKTPSKLFTNHNALGQLTNHNALRQLTNHNAPGQLTNHNAPGQLTNHNAPGQLTNHNAPGQLTNHNAPGQLTNHNALGQLTNHNALGQLTNHNALGQLTNHNAPGQLTNHNALGQLTNHNALRQLTNHNALGQLTNHNTFSFSEGGASSNPELIEAFVSGWGERYCNNVNYVKNNVIFEPPSMRAYSSTPQNNIKTL